MKTYNALSVLALLVLVVALPLYAMREGVRMAQSEQILQDHSVSEAAVLYIENCAVCHGMRGEGVGMMPTLAGDVLANADRRLLYRTIANSPHGSAMAAWHLSEGGILTTYEVEGLVALIQTEAWPQVEALAASGGIAVPTPFAQNVDFTTMEGNSEDPHECRACHEEPAVHADRFGLNCARCHSMQAWKPALLTRHIFPLDHGDLGTIACQTCHTTSYTANTCYGCHDHTVEDMETVHVEAGIAEYEDCIACHPTGTVDEALDVQAAHAAEMAGN